LHFLEGVQLGQVSTDDQSCERQERDLRAFARRAGHHVVGVFKETASGAKNDRAERNKVMALAQAHEVDAVLVKISVLAQTGLSFDLSIASGKLMRTIMAGLAEFERDASASASSQAWPPPRRAAWYSVGRSASGRRTRRRRSGCSPCTIVVPPVNWPFPRCGVTRI
jgi:DNA invertase Pin-like site-specific DNA recombinase